MAKAKKPAAPKAPAKRGRPPKAATAAPKAPAKRGRPPKAAAAAPKAPAKRGRPPKAAAAKAPAKKAPVKKAAPVKKVAAPKKAAAPVETATKSKAGRPPTLPKVPVTKIKLELAASIKAAERSLAKLQKLYDSI